MNNEQIRSEIERRSGMAPGSLPSGAQIAAQIRAQEEAKRMESLSINVVPQTVEIVSSREEIEFGLARIEKMGRICWQSEPKSAGGGFSPEPFIRMLIGRHHESVLEHGSISVILITDRAVTHQLVRHRLMSPSQESQRYCCYTKDKFGAKLTVVKPQGYDSYSEDMRLKFEQACENAYRGYQYMLEEGCKPEEARRLLPSAAKSQIGITANIREWRHIFKERLNPAAEPQTRALVLAIRKALSDYEYLFEDIEYSEKDILCPVAVPEIKTMAEILASMGVA